jgi:hypothetical protein
MVDSTARRRRRVGESRLSVSGAKYWWFVFVWPGLRLYALISRVIVRILSKVPLISLPNCRPVTPEAAGSSPVARAKDFNDLAWIWSYRVDTVRFRDELTLLAFFASAR